MKSAIITGGSDGLGFAIAKRLSKTHNVYLLARNQEKLKKAANELNCKYIVCDVANNIQIERALSKMKTDNIEINTLINCAGLWIQGPLEENSPEQIRSVLEANTLGTILMTRAVLPFMKKTGVGKILNVISRAGLIYKSERSTYCASKWAITGFTKCLAEELSNTKIKVMGFYPDGMATNFFEKNGNFRDKTKLLDVDSAADAVIFMLNQKDNVLISDLDIKSLEA